MVLGMPASPGRLRHAQTLELKIGGAESNVAIALSRLGITAGWVSCLSSDELGQLVLDRIRGEGVDTSRVNRIPHRPTGLFLREQIGREARAYYYREGSAACEMSPDFFDPDYLKSAEFLHLTGVTPALSENCRRFTLWSAEQARERGVRVSFDVNYRSKLWAAEDAKNFVEELLPLIDVLFTGDEEASALWGKDDVGLLRELSAAGPPEVVLKRGAEGSLTLLGNETFEQPAFSVNEVDPVGAGDSFAAGYLAGHLWDLNVKDRLQIACAMGAYSVMTLGDYEGLPDREELEAFSSDKKTLGR
jgi:2-dehydro-3-deoxygluconokinase